LGPGTKPVEDAAEVDQPDPVLLEQIPLTQRSRGPNRLVKRARVSAPDVGEAVEEDDHVGVPLGVELVDPELAAPRAGAPVDPPDPVAGGERAQVPKLEPFPFLPPAP